MVNRMWLVISAFSGVMPRASLRPDYHGLDSLGKVSTSHSNLETGMSEKRVKVELSHRCWNWTHIDSETAFSHLKRENERVRTKQCATSRYLKLTRIHIWNSTSRLSVRLEISYTQQRIYKQCYEFCSGIAAVKRLIGLVCQHAADTNSDATRFDIQLAETTMTTCSETVKWQRRDLMEHVSYCQPLM